MNKLYFILQIAILLHT